LLEDKPGKRRHHQGRVAWIAMRKVVERELAEGWSVRAVYDRHAAEFEGKLSYPQLVRYVRPLRAKEATPRPVAEKAPLPTPAPDESSEPDPKPLPFTFVRPRGSQ